MSATQVILLERIEKLGQMGDVVNVKPGYARNFLIPQNKALRATKDNVAYFEGQRKALEAANDKQKSEAETLAKKLSGLKAPLIRAASEAGHLYGSVTSRDIANEVAAASGEAVTRNMVEMNRSFKEIGLFPVNIILHPEVKTEIIINIARTTEEAQTQAETGRALIADAKEDEVVETEAALEEVMDEDALEAEKEKLAEDAAKEEADAAKDAEIAEKQAAKRAEMAEAAAAEPSEEMSEEVSKEEGAE